MSSLEQKSWDQLLLIARTILPPLEKMDAAERERFRRIIDAALLSRPAGVRRRFALFLSIVHRAPFLRYGRSFSALSASQRTAALGWLQDCPIRLLRSGFWGLKTLVFMGYYGQVENWPRVNYTPSTSGNDRLHA